MLKVKNVSVGTEGYGDAYECTVTFQVGDQSYNTVAVKLPPDATRTIVERAVSFATTMLRVQPSEIRIAGEPRPEVEAAPDLEFAEVDEAPVAPMPSPEVPAAPEPEFI